MSMFGALNRFISRLDSDGPPQNSGLGRGAAGFQVIRNKNDEVPLEPWFDFIVGINGRQIDNPDPNLFAMEVRNCAGSVVTLTLWSAKGQQVRDIHLPIPTPSPTLGLTLQWTPLSLTNDVWHILEVIPNSPADNAGLLPYSDYIVGTPEGIVRGESGLGELVEDYMARPLRLFVYNHEYDVTRLLTLTPSRNWGGEGALGCVLGYGHLHKIPPPLNEPPAGPGDTLFETARFSNESQRPRSASPSHAQQNNSGSYNITSPSLMVPAQMLGGAPPLAPKTPSAAPPRGPRKARHGTSPNRAFDEYLKESEEKSKEDDYVPKAKATPPPPPKLKEISTRLPVPPPSGGEPRQTRSPDPILDDDEDDS